MKTKQIVLDLREKLEDIEQELNALQPYMRQLEQRVAGTNAAYWRAANDLIHMASNATEEAATWLEGIK